MNRSPDATLTAQREASPAATSEPSSSAGEPGRYELGAEHAAGGVGRIYRAHDHRLERTVAIKVLADGVDARARARFVREALVTAQLQHPNIVPIYDLGSSRDGRPYYAMKLVGGRTLAEATGAAPSLAERLALLPHVLAVAEGVAYAHREGIVHRDLKPSNVMVGDFGETIVLDWGLARDHRLGDEPAQPDEAGRYELSHAHATRPGAILGTPAFMAPEQARGEPADARSDVYALGAMLYFVLVARAPFEGDTDEVLARVARTPAPAPSTLMRGLPTDMLAIVAKAMAPEPARRYQDAKQLAGDLARFLAGQQVGARRYGWLALLGLALRRHRWLAMVGAGALLAVLVIAALAFARVRRERSAAQAAARHEKLRADDLVLAQAESALVKDPTRALAWLKTYPLDGADWPRVRALARAAIHQGVARQVLQPIGPPVQMMAWSRGRLLVVDGRRTLRLLDPAGGPPRTVCLPAEMADDAAEHQETSEHELVLTLFDGRIVILDEELALREQLAPVAGAIGASLSSDGRWAAIASKSGLVTIIDRRTGAETWLEGSDARIDDVQFVAGTTRLLLTTASASAELYDVTEGRFVYHFWPQGVRHSTSPYGRYVLLRGRDDLVWMDALTLETRALRVKLTTYAADAFLPDGRVVYADRTNAMQLWDPRRNRVEALPVPTGSGPSASADGRRIAFVDLRARLYTYDLVTGDKNVYRGHVPAAGTASVFVASGEVASRTLKGDVRIWNIDDKQPDRTIELGGAEPFTPRFVLVEDGRALVAGAADGRVLRIDATEGTSTLLMTGDGAIARVAATPSGDVVVATDAHGALWRHDSHRRLNERLFTDAAEAQEFLLTRDGRFVIGLSYHSGFARLWDLEGRTERALPDVFSSCVEVALSPDGTTLASCPDPDTSSLVLYDLAHATTRRLHAPSTEVQLHGFSPSSRHLFASDARGAVLRWDVATGVLTERPAVAGEAAFGVALSDDVLVSARNGRLDLTMMPLGATVALDRSLQPHGIFVSSDGALVGGMGTTEDTGLFVWDLATRERWNVPLYEPQERPGFTHDHWLVQTADDGKIRFYRPPAPLADAAATHAWLDAQTTATLERPVAAGCE